MAVSDTQIADMMRTDSAAAAPGPQPEVPPSGPMTAPMSTPEPKMGTKEAAMVNLSMALDLIEQSLPALGSESPEGKQAVAALRSLSGLLGPRKGKTGELQQAEIMQLLGALPQAGGASPEAKAMAGGAPAPAAPPMPGAGMPAPMPGAPGPVPQPMM